MADYEERRADLFVRTGAVDGGSLQVAHLGRAVDTRSTRATQEARLEGCGRAVAVKTTTHGTREILFRELELDPGGTIETLWHQNLFVKGPFREIHRETNANRAEVAWRVWPVRERFVRQLPFGVDPEGLQVDWESIPGGERWRIELRRPGHAAVRARGGSADEVEARFAAALADPGSGLSNG
ncbi:MAG: hypothetical protein H0V89_13940 [Deltaproteobacteria bacterium]|nr:hypothetical protein [Deltaproteobacteria bacterium]